MISLSRPPLLLAAALLGLGLARAAPLLPYESVPLTSLASFRSPSPNWRIAGGLEGDPRRETTLKPTPGSGIVVSLPGEGKDNLLTTWEHADLDLELEFLIPPKSNSGVYLMGRYEVQIYDSWTVANPRYVDCGSIYQRWDETRPEGQKSYEGSVPRANACRAPGLWQRLQVEFEAPRFDASGKKLKNARFRRVWLNGFLVQENVEVTGATRGHSYQDKPEGPTGPLLLQGDHGPVAFRAISVKRYATERVAAVDLHYRLYSGEFNRIGEYDQKPPTREGVPEIFSHSAIQKSGKYALVFTGVLVAPRDGDYGFKVPSEHLSGSTVQLRVDDQLAVVPVENSGTPAVIGLTKGRHPFRFDLIYEGPGRPAMDIFVEGPGMPIHAITAPSEARRSEGDRERLLEPTDGMPVVQRSFVPFEPRKRLYAVNVGTPSGIHFAYDFETGALLRGWRGRFLDTSMMWNGRGNGQLGRPAGPALTFDGLPEIALIELGQSDDWPSRPDPLWSSQGYKLGSDGLPTFLSRLSGLEIRDRIAPAARNPGLTRTIELNGELSGWSTWILLASGSKITPQPGREGWVIGDREWYLDWPANATVTPVVRPHGDHQQLAVPITRSALGQPVTYTIVW